MSGPASDAPDGSPRASPSQAGEALPPERRLARPPGDRYGARSAEPLVHRPDVPRALLLGAAAGLGTAVLTAILHAVLSITAGLVAISVLGGWLIGVAVRTGAWSGRPHRPSSTPLALAAVLAVATWLLGFVLAWVLSMALLPASTRPFLERLVSTPFLDWLGPQLGPLDLLAAGLLTGVAWAAAHTTALERAAEPRS